MANKKKSRSGKTKKVKKPDVATPEKITISIATIREFIAEVQSEFKKVVWPDKKVTSGLTAFVIILVIVISIYLGSVDLLLGELVSFVLQ